MWNIEKIVSKGDYLYGVCKNHPKANKYGYVLLHRLIVENHIGRILNDEEVIHHKDGNKKNNSIENLEILNRIEHCKLHAKKGRLLIELICPNCEKTFIREKRQIKKNTLPKCSRKCNGIYSRKLQLGLL